MKRILGLIVFVLTAFILLATLTVTAVERPSAPQGNGFATLSSMEQAMYSVPL